MVKAEFKKSEISEPKSATNLMDKNESSQYMGLTNNQSFYNDVLIESIVDDSPKQSISNNQPAISKNNVFDYD